MTKRFKTAALGCALAACMALVMAGCSATSGSTYTPAEKTPVVSSPTIGQSGTLRVGVDTGSSPLAGMVDNKIVGLDVDIAAALADSLGLKLSIVDVGSDPASALADGKVDIVMGIDKSADVEFWCSDVYLPTGVALFATSGNASAPTASSNPTFAAQVSSRSAWAVMNEYGESTLTSTNNLAEAFKALSAGTVQYVAADAIVGTYAAHGNKMDVAVVALLQQAGGYCIGVSDTNTDLKTTISDAVATLTGNGVISVVETKWLGAPLDLASVSLTDAAQALASVSSTTTSTSTQAAATTTTDAAAASSTTTTTTTPGAGTAAV